MSSATNTVSIQRVIDLAARGYKDSASEALAQFSKEHSLSTEQKAAIQRVLNKISLDDTSEVFARKKEKIFSVLENWVPLFDLPPEMLHEVLSHLPAKDVCQCSLVCEQLFHKTISNANPLWQKLYNRDYQAEFPITANCTDYFKVYKGCHLTPFNMQNGIYTSSVLKKDYQVGSWSLVDGKIISTSYETKQIIQNNEVTLLHDKHKVIIEDMDFNEEPLIITPDQGFVLAHALVNNRLFLGSEANHSITIWNAATGESMGSLEGHTAPVCCLFSNRKNLVSCSCDSSIKIWNLQDSTCLSSFEKPFDFKLIHLRCMVDEILFTSQGPYIQMWDVMSMTLQRQWKASEVPSSEVETMTVAEGSLFVSSRDNRVRMWDLNTLKQKSVQQPQCTKTFYIESWTPLELAISNGKLFVRSFDHNLYILDIKNGAQCLFRGSSRQRPIVKAGKVFCKVRTGIQVLDFTADYVKVVNEIAKDLEEAEKTRSQHAYGAAIYRFFRMPESVKQGVYKELGKILPLPLEGDIVKRAENAFFGKCNENSTCAQKNQAIRNYIQNSRSQQG